MHYSKGFKNLITKKMANEFKKENDQLLGEKSKFIQRMYDLVQTIANIEMQPILIGGEVKRAVLFVALDDVGEKTRHQTVVAGMGEPRYMELAAEALIDHPQLGGLIISKVMEKLINSGELRAEIIKMPMGDSDKSHLN